ncbi:MAG: hypothetical protein M0P61_06875 [Ignavibacteriaceae bacterium]|jgi:hypothetical protein|nr:hypothetical protein [Ignavibacteriaceae bacterium]
MFDLKKKYIVDEENKKVAVQIDIGTFTQIEEILENYGLAKLITENSDDETLSVKEAKSLYNSLN